MDRYGGEGSGLRTVVLVLVTIGALNWGLIGFFNWNLVDALFGGGAREQTAAFPRFIYALVGLAGLIIAVRPLVRRQGGLTPRATVRP